MTVAGASWLICLTSCLALVIMSMQGGCRTLACPVFVGLWRDYLNQQRRAFHIHPSPSQRWLQGSVCNHRDDRYRYRRYICYCGAVFAATGTVLTDPHWSDSSIFYRCWHTRKFPVWIPPTIQFRRSLRRVHHHHIKCSISRKSCILSLCCFAFSMYINCSMVTETGSALRKNGRWFRE